MNSPLDIHETAAFSHTDAIRTLLKVKKKQQLMSRTTLVITGLAIGYLEYSPLKITAISGSANSIN